MAGRSRGPDLRSRIVLPYELAALSQSLGMGEDDLYLALSLAHQAVPYGNVNLSHDHHIQAQKKIIDHRHRTLQAVLQRDDSIVQLAFFHSLQDSIKVLEVDQDCGGHAL